MRKNVGRKKEEKLAGCSLYSLDKYEKAWACETGLRNEIKVFLWSASRHEERSDRSEKRILGT